MKKFTGILLAVVLAFSMTACGSTEKETEPQTETVIETEAQLKAYGEDVEGAWKVQLKNSTGSDIKAIAVKKTADVEFSESLLKEDEIIAADEEVVIYYAGSEAAAAEEADAEEKALNDTYDVSITLADDTTYVLTAFPFEDMEACEIKVEDEVAFVEYVSLSTEETISTKEAELAIKAAAEVVYEEEAEDDYVYDGGTSGGGSVNQGSDECLGDDALTYDDPVDQGSDSCLGGADVNQGSDSCLGGAEVNTPSVDQGSDECLGDDAMTW